LGASLAFASLAYATVAGCGGESISNHGSDDDDGVAGTSGGGASGKGGTSGNQGGIVGKGGTQSKGGAAGAVSGASGTGGAVSIGGTSGVSGTGGIGGEPNDCFLEPDPGPCLASMRRFAFDATTGLCLPFTYGGCDGNANNFESAETCYTSCGVGPPDCATPSDCTLMRARCCGCEEPSLDNVVGVNRQRQSAVSSAMGCDLVDCVQCAATSNPWLGATCSSGRCIAFDARQTNLTLCMTSDECHLRSGLECCESCTATPGTLVALNELDPRPLLCGNSAVACDACVPALPAGAFAACVDGRCSVAVDE